MAPVSEDFLTTTSPAWDPARVVGKFPRLPGAVQAEGGRRRRGIFRRRDPDKPLVTVLTPCFNAADSLAETIASVGAQSYPNIEHIVLDGGSTDGTRALLGAFDDTLDYYVSAPDDGLYDALNNGLALAAGEFVMMLSADDVYTPWAVETLLRNRAASGADVVGGLAALKGADGAISHVHTRDGYTARCLIAMCLRFES
ncbi:MAG: glycosyltransferase, partial [Thalassobaculaceae bacterium]